jgi:hypothetical protein
MAVGSLVFDPKKAMKIFQVRLSLTVQGTRCCNYDRPYDLSSIPRYVAVLQKLPKRRSDGATR